MATGTTLINQAYKKIGVFTPTSVQQTEALTELNQMLTYWGVNFLVPSLTRENFTLTIGNSEYTIGDGEDFDTERPIQLIHAFVRDSGNDTALKVSNGTRYHQVYDKSNSGKPTEVYYLTEYPAGTIIFNKEPDAAYVCYFEFVKNFTELATLATELSLPPEYQSAIVYNLAVKLGENHTMPAADTIVAMAESSLMAISRLSVANEVRMKLEEPLSDLDKAEFRGTSFYPPYSTFLRRQ